MIDTIALGFARRQTPTSSYAHFDGAEENLISLVQSHMGDAIAVNENRTILRVPVPASWFWSAVRPVIPGEKLRTTFERRRPGEEPVLRTIASGSKTRARHVEIILYHRDVLGKEASTDAEWEIVSINASPMDEPIPMDPTTMARNQLAREGGTFQRNYTPEEWAQAAWFWATHVSVQP